MAESGRPFIAKDLGPSVSLCRVGPTAEIQPYLDACV